MNPEFQNPSFDFKENGLQSGDPEPDSSVPDTVKFNAGEIKQKMAPEQMKAALSRLPKNNTYNGPNTILFKPGETQEILRVERAAELRAALKEARRRIHEA
jgi:hypothetical protein